MVPWNNSKTKINAPFIMQAQHIGKFLFSWKPYLNLYLKWDMTFRSPHIFFSFLFFFYFLWREKKKKSDQVLSQHIKVFYLSHYKAHLECSLSSLVRALSLVSKVWSIFIFHSQMGLAPSSKSLVNWFKKISSFNPHWAFGELTHVFRF